MSILGGIYNITNTLTGENNITYENLQVNFLTINGLDLQTELNDLQTELYDLQSGVNLKANINNPSFTGHVILPSSQIITPNIILVDLSSNQILINKTLKNTTFSDSVSGLNKSLVGLDNVDNTSDINKPISIATQNALNLKANINNASFSGNIYFSGNIILPSSQAITSSDILCDLSSNQILVNKTLKNTTFSDSVNGINKSIFWIK